MNHDVTIRAATVADAQAMHDIYAYYVENTALNYDYEAPSVAYFEKKIACILTHYPALIAEADGEVIGYCYANQFRDMEAYAWGPETTIYLKPGTYRRGLGRQLYTLLEDILKSQGFVKMIAVLTTPIDERSDMGSLQFHERLGFVEVGHMDHCGYKFGRWYSTTWMEKMIGEPKDDMVKPLDFDGVREQFGL